MTPPPLDVERLRADYPILSREVYGHPLVYLDNTASTQTPRPVVEAVTDMYFSHKANVHRGVHRLSQEATDLMEEARRKAAGFIGAHSPEEVIFTYLLKEYRNRWFLICEKSTNRAPQVNIFALDRIHSVKIDKEHPFRKCVDFDPEHFFDDTIGVTKQISDKARRVVIKVDRQQAPYVESKPFHKSQKVEQRFRDGSIQLSLKVVINNELERLILGYGGHAEVIAPPEFRARIAESVRIAAGHYSDV